MNDPITSDFWLGNTSVAQSLRSNMELKLNMMLLISHFSCFSVIKLVVPQIRPADMMLRRCHTGACQLVLANDANSNNNRDAHLAFMTCVWNVLNSNDII